MTPTSRSGLATRSGGFGQGMFMPQIEVAQRGNQLVVHADLPGLSKDDVHIDVTNDGLIISGERRQQHEDRQEGYYRSERSYGSFRRLIPLPETANIEGATATFNNGVLEITIPNEQQQPRGRRIEIQDAAQSGSSTERSGGEQQASAQTTGQQQK